jgi:hypothetical protein
MPPRVTPFNVSTECRPFHFLRKQRLRLCCTLPAAALFPSSKGCRTTQTSDQKKKSRAFKLGDRDGHATGPPLLTHLPWYLSFTYSANCLPKCGASPSRYIHNRTCISGAHPLTYSAVVKPPPIVFHVYNFHSFRTIRLPTRQYFPTLPRTLASSPSETSTSAIINYLTLEIKALWSFETSASIRPTAQGHIPDDFNLLCIIPSRFFCPVQRELLVHLTASRVNGVLRHLGCGHVTNCIWWRNVP